MKPIHSIPYSVAHDLGEGHSKLLLYNTRIMDTTRMGSRKTKRSEASKAIARAIIDQYQPTNAEEIQDALKDIFGSVIEAMLQGEMDFYLGYDAHDHGYRELPERL